MDETSFSFDAADGVSVSVYRWTNVAPAKAIVQIAHGMGEHAARYRRLAEALTAAGYVVYANDHRGHGTTAGSPDRFGDLGPSGWAGLVSDLRRARRDRSARASRPSARRAGSQHGLVRPAGIPPRHSADVDGAVLSGTTAIDVIAPGIDPTKEVDLSAFNAPFEPARTEYDWLSRDPDEVDTYVADPACGFGLNPSATASMLDGLADTGDAARLAGIRGDLPIYLLSGDADPLAGGGALIELVADRYRQGGVKDVTVALYPGARHEVFNETNRDEITADLIAWLDRITAAEA